MAKFAQYYIQFVKESGCHNWEDRQDYLAQLLAEDNILFGDGKIQAPVLSSCCQS